MATYRAILRLGLPILVGQIGMIVVGFADNIMVGRYSTEALASASFVNNLFNIAIFACLGFSYGLTPLVASLFASNKKKEVGQTVRIALWCNLVFSLLVGFVMALFYIFLDRLGQPEELIPTIRPYFLLYLSTVIPVAVFNVFSQWSYGINNSGMPMWIILATNIFNICGNFVLIYGNFGFPELGLTGAGISTLSARIIAAIAILAVFFFSKKNRDYRQGFTSRGMSTSVLKIVSTSLPIAFQLTLESGLFTFAAFVAGWIGAIALASYQIIVVIGTLGFCVYYSMAAAVSVIVANAAGEGNREQMRLRGFAGYHIILFLAAIASAVFYFLGPEIIHAFTTDSRVVTQTTVLLLPLILYQVADATQINFSNALRGTANVAPIAWVALVSYLFIGAPTTYLVAIPAGLGLVGVVVSFSVALLCAGLGFLYFFLKTTSQKVV